MLDMLVKIKLDFLEDLHLGKVYVIKNFSYSSEQQVHHVTLELYWKQQQVHVHVKQNYLDLFSFVFNKNGVLEYSFNHTDDKFLFLHLQNIVSLLNKSFYELDKSIEKIKSNDDFIEAFPPYVFQNEENSIDNIFYNEVKLKIIDLDFTTIFTGHIVRKYNNLYYIVSNPKSEIVSLLKLKLKNDTWYFIDSYFKGIHIDPPLLLNAFFIPLDGNNLIDTPMDIKHDKLVAKLASLNLNL